MKTMAMLLLGASWFLAIASVARGGMPCEYWLCEELKTGLCAPSPHPYPQFPPVRAARLRGREKVFSAPKVSNSSRITSPPTLMTANRCAWLQARGQTTTSARRRQSTPREPLGLETRRSRRGSGDRRRGQLAATWMPP